MLTVPQQPPALSTTGKIVSRCSWSFRRASSIDSSASQQAGEGCMIASTRTSEARRSSAATPQQTSRSVTTPTSSRLSASSTTGAQPWPNRASLAQRLRPCLAAYSTMTLELVPSHRYNNSSDSPRDSTPSLNHCVQSAIQSDGRSLVITVFLLASCQDLRCAASA